MAGHGSAGLEWQVLVGLVRHSSVGQARLGGSRWGLVRQASQGKASHGGQGLAGEAGYAMVRYVMLGQVGLVVVRSGSVRQVWQGRLGRSGLVGARNGRARCAGAGQASQG